MPTSKQSQSSGLNFSGLRIVVNEVSPNARQIARPVLPDFKHIAITPFKHSVDNSPVDFGAEIPLGNAEKIVRSEVEISLKKHVKDSLRQASISAASVIAEIKTLLEPQHADTANEIFAALVVHPEQTKMKLGSHHLFPLYVVPQGGDNLDEEDRSGPDLRATSKEPVPVSLRRVARPITRDVALWLLIKRNADAMSWSNYNEAINFLFACEPQNTQDVGKRRGNWEYLQKVAKNLGHRRYLPFNDTDAYRALKVSTEAFVTSFGGIALTDDSWSNQSGQIIDAMSQDATVRALADERLGVKLSEQETFKLAQGYTNPMIPYLQRVVENLQGSGIGDQARAVLEVLQNRSPDDPCGCDSLGFDCFGSVDKLSQPPLIELIWSYWMEEMNLVQTMNAVCLRFQNMSSGPKDPLSGLELDPLRPLNNLLWGYVQDEQHRLTIERRAYEYAHQYGFSLIGRAVPNLRPADSRSKFVEAFHVLMGLCVQFYKQADDTTVVADGFPILNALREVHLILSAGAHNQFRDLPTTARIEMMMQQWLLARPEFREFLPRRTMVALPEPWMHSVESMRKLQGWGDGNTFQFWQLATTGEQILASIRYGNWNTINDATNAANWANFFRPEVQTYIHAYRAVTGIDISAEPADSQSPSTHLLRRLRQAKRLAA